MQTCSRAALAAAAVLILAAPAGASAATKTVDMGTPPSAAKAAQKAGVDFDAFFPSVATIHAGDSVKFAPVGFHTVQFPKKGTSPAGLVAPAGTVSGATDAAGAPFWFNGLPQLGFNPALLKSGFGKSFTYTGAKAVGSGLPLQNKPKPMKVKFPKAGTYTYFCNVHPGMKGTVRVVGKSKPVPSAAADKASVKKQLAAAFKAAKPLGATKAPANSVVVGPQGKGGVAFFGFAPSKLTVPVGTTVSFAMPSRSFEAHTVTFGPGNPQSQPTSYLGQLAASFNSPAFDPRATYPSEAPGTVATLTPALHGNGFWNAGILDTAPATPLPNSGKVTFGQAGTYDYYCMIHPFMHGQVVAQ